MSTPDFLTEIIARRRRRVAARRAAQDVETLRVRARGARAGMTARRLTNALRHHDGINVIAEIKRASPSKGTIREEVVPAELAREYAEGGACAVSVLTEEEFFRGSLDDLKAVREAIGLPVLRKDFVVDEFQVYEAALAGADALLLIVAALDDEQLTRLRALAEDELGMDALVEVHDADEMRRAQDCGATLVGVNNRDLRSFKVSLGTSFQLAKLAHGGMTLVSESGLRDASDLRGLRAIGYHGFLVGETLMRAADARAALRSLRGAVDGAAAASVALE